MRGKVAKHIRRLVKENFPNSAERLYEEKKHKAKIVPTGLLNAEGKPTFFTLNPVTIKLNSNCQRSTVQEIKRFRKSQRGL